MPKPNPFISVAEAAQRLGITPQRVRKLIAEGKIPADRLGQAWLIRPASLESVKVYGVAGRPKKSA